MARVGRRIAEPTPQRFRGTALGPPRPVLVALLVFGVVAGSLDGQMRRATGIQPVAEVQRGDLLLGIGWGRAQGGAFPLAGLTGDLWSLGEITVAYALGDRALIQLDGAAIRVLSIRSRSESAIPLDPGVADGTVSDTDDFRITAAFAPFGSREGWSAGGVVEVKLPNSDERRGIGLNTTDVMLGLLGSWGGGAWRASGRLGVAILEAPLENFEQNDLAAYAVEVLFRPYPRLRLSVGIDGLANTRDVIPLGTEDVGEATAGAEWRVGAWQIDLGLGRGYAGNSPDWRVVGGIAWNWSGSRVP